MISHTQAKKQVLTKCKLLVSLSSVHKYYVGNCDRAYEKGP